MILGNVLEDLIPRHAVIVEHACAVDSRVNHERVASVVGNDLQRALQRHVGEVDSDFLADALARCGSGVVAMLGCRAGAGGRSPGRPDGCLASLLTRRGLVLNPAVSLNAFVDGCEPTLVAGSESK